LAFFHTRPGELVVVVAEERHTERGLGNRATPNDVRRGTAAGLKVERGAADGSPCVAGDDQLTGTVARVRRLDAADRIRRGRGADSLAVGRDAGLEPPDDPPSSAHAFDSEYVPRRGTQVVSSSVPPASAQAACSATGSELQQARREAHAGAGATLFVLQASERAALASSDTKANPEQRRFMNT
jgi:hypothetical protein